MTRKRITFSDFLKKHISNKVFIQLIELDIFYPSFVLDEINRSGLINEYIITEIKYPVLRGYKNNDAHSLYVSSFIDIKNGKIKHYTRNNQD